MRELSIFVNSSLGLLGLIPVLIKTFDFSKVSVSNLSFSIVFLKEVASLKRSSVISTSLA